MQPAQRPNALREKLPTRWQSLVFAGKVRGLQAKRWWYDRSSAVQRWPQLTSAAPLPFSREHRSLLWTELDPRERAMELGKVENLRRAAQRIHNTEIPAGGIFSFWKQVGRADRASGFVEGRMLQQGCIIPAVGGGLCQLSNALYALALETGCEIIERHAHSARLPHMPTNDATVAWNYVDLRFRVPQTMRITAQVEQRELVLAFASPQRFAFAPANFDVLPPPPINVAPRSCFTCGESSCFRHERAAAGKD